MRTDFDHDLDSSLSLPYAPLDIFLTRAHALPLPYLTTPTLNFLVHISSRAYFSLCRSSASSSYSGTPQLFDIPMPALREYISKHTYPRTTSPSSSLFTIASLRVSPSRPSPLSSHLGTPAAQPSFVLLPSLSENFEHAFLEHPDYEWVLDFSDSTGGNSAGDNITKGGVVMRQSAMREIAGMVGSGAQMNGMMGSSAKGLSWVDLLVCFSLLVNL